MDDKNKKMVYTVVERTQAGGVTKSYWTKVGVGFVNRDGSINLQLDAIPISGKLQVREWESFDRRPDPADGNFRPRPRPEPSSANDSLI